MTLKTLREEAHVLGLKYALKISSAESSEEVQLLQSMMLGRKGELTELVKREVLDMDAGERKVALDVMSEVRTKISEHADKRIAKLADSKYV